MDSQSGSDAPITGMDDLLAPFHEACKPRSAFRVGTEAEKLGVFEATGEPIPFTGERSVQAVLMRLAERFHWTPVREHEAGEVIALHRGDASVTLEPAGQLELSGAPFASIHETDREFREHLSEVSEVSKDLGIAWLSLGINPFARHEELPRVPKFRYGIMESYLPTRGSRALDMMRRTCTVQANLDYASESDAMRKLRVALALQPVVTAMFANSPYLEGRATGRLSERADVWLNMDPDRSGILPFAWHSDVSFRAYVEWALDVPMFLIKRGARVIPNTHQTFRMYLADGNSGEQATLTDWRTHLNTLFPEARLKNILEMRGADAQSTELLPALPALWKGLLDDEQALANAERLISPLNAEMVAAVRPDITRKGLRVQLADRPLQEWAADVLEISSAGLARFAVDNARGENESIYLQPLHKLVAEGTTPAEQLLARVGSSSDFRARVIAATRVA